MKFFCPNAFSTLLYITTSADRESERVRERVALSPGVGKISRDKVSCTRMATVVLYRGRTGGGGGETTTPWLLLYSVCYTLRPVAWLYLYQAEVDWNIFHRCTHSFFTTETERDRGREKNCTLASWNPPGFSQLAFSRSRRAKARNGNAKLADFFMGKMATSFLTQHGGAFEKRYTFKGNNVAETLILIFFIKFFIHIYIYWIFFLNLIFIKIQLVWKLSKIFK